MRSTRRPDAGDNGDGDGDPGDGDGDPGDGDGDPGDGDGDGDPAEGDGFIDIGRELVPLPEGAIVEADGFGQARSYVAHLSDEGHVLIRAYFEGEVRAAPFIWRGGSEPPERVVLPAEYEDVGALCLLDNDRVFVSDSSKWVAGIVESATQATAFELPDRVTTEDYLVIEFCNSVGQVLARTAGGTWLLGSGAPIKVNDGLAVPQGLNDSGHALFDLGYWNGMEFVDVLADKFKPYSGPSNDGLMLGSFDELHEDKEIATLWNPELTGADALTFLPRLPPPTMEVIGPMLLGSHGHALVGTAVRNDPNTVYIYDNGKFGLLGVAGESFGEVINMNAKGQVLTKLGTSMDAEHIGIVFSP